MPIKWTPELDSILLHAVFEESGISFSKALCNKISERVKGTGIDCTPKAVENRLYSWKKKNVSASPAASAAATPGKDASTPGKGGKGGKASTSRARGGKKAVPNQITPESEEPESPSLRGRKRVKTEERDDEEVPEEKVKMENLDEDDEVEV